MCWLDTQVAVAGNRTNRLTDVETWHVQNPEREREREREEKPGKPGRTWHRAIKNGWSLGRGEDQSDWQRCPHESWTFFQSSSIIRHPPCNIDEGHGCFDGKRTKRPSSSPTFGSRPFWNTARKTWATWNEGKPEKKETKKKRPVRCRVLKSFDPQINLLAQLQIGLPIR